MLLRGNHVFDHFIKHFVGRCGLSLARRCDIRQRCSPDLMHLNIALLPETPKPANSLVVLLVTVVVEISSSGTVLSVDAKSRNLRLCNKELDVTSAESGKLRFLRIVTVCA